MTDRITKLQRWIDLIAFLSARRYPVAVDQIMESVPAYARKWADGSDTDRRSARRMFERDKDELRDAGIPMETTTYTINYGSEQVEGYQLESNDFYLPYLKLVAQASGEPLDRDARGESAARAGTAKSRGPTFEIDAADASEALSAIREATEWPGFPLAREARSAYRKLAFDLNTDRLLDPPSVLYLDRPGAAEIQARVRTLTDALLARKRVRFRYSGIQRDTTTDRNVAPYGLLFQQGHWYLIGEDALRDDIRVFRTGRMEDLQPNQKTPATPDYDVPDGFRLTDYRDRRAWELGDDDDDPPIRAEVLFHFPASLLAERNGYGELIEERDDGSAVRVFAVRQSQPFIRWVLGFAGEAEMVNPPELKTELRSLARDVVALYSGGTEGANDS